MSEQDHSDQAERQVRPNRSALWCTDQSAKKNCPVKKQVVTTSRGVTEADQNPFITNGPNETRAINISSRIRDHRTWLHVCAWERLVSGAEASRLSRFALSLVFSATLMEFVRLAFMTWATASNNPDTAAISETRWGTILSNIVFIWGIWENGESAQSDRRLNRK